MRTAIKATLATSILFGAVYSLDYFLPEKREIEMKRESKVVYDRNGEVYVHSNVENMMNYLMKEDPDKLKKAYDNLERRLK